MCRERHRPVTTTAYDALTMRSPLRQKAHGQSGLLNGTWLVMDGQIGGVRLTDNAFDELTLTLRNGRFELGQDRGRIAFDREAAPAALDVLIDAGPNRGRYVPAIVERVGPLLRICFDLSGTERPATFRAPAGTRNFLATFRSAPACARRLPSRVA